MRETKTPVVPSSLCFTEWATSRWATRQDRRRPSLCRYIPPLPRLPAMRRRPGRRTLPYAFIGPLKQFTAGNGPHPIRRAEGALRSRKASSATRVRRPGVDGTARGRRCQPNVVMPARFATSSVEMANHHGGAGIKGRLPRNWYRADGGAAGSSTRSCSAAICCVADWACAPARPTPRWPSTATSTRRDQQAVRPADRGLGARPVRPAPDPDTRVSYYLRTGKARWVRFSDVAARSGLLQHGCERRVWRRFRASSRRMWSKISELTMAIRTQLLTFGP
jgi:hypothetical protein